MLVYSRTYADLEHTTMDNRRLTMCWACKYKAFGNTILSDRLTFAPACQKVQVSEENESHPPLAGHYSCQVPSAVIFLLKVM